MFSTYFDKNKSRWIFDFDKVVKGRRLRASKTLPAGWTRSQAETYGKNEIARLYAVATGTADERVMIASAVLLYIKERCPKLKNGHGAMQELKRIQWCYKGKYIDELSEVARDFRRSAFREVDGKKVPLSDASIRNKLSYLRAACRYVQKNHDMAKNVSTDIAMPSVKNERQEYATRGEMLRICRACTHRHTRAIIRVGFYTGMRLGEIMAIDRDGSKSRISNDMFFLSNTKNGKDRFVPISGKIRVLLKYFPVPFQKRWIQRQFERARDAAGFPGLHLHDIRHSAASAMINNGVDLYTVGAVLGHADSRSTKRYSHLNTESLKTAIGKIK